MKRKIITLFVMVVFFWSWPYRFFTKKNNCYFWTLEQLIKHGGSVKWTDASNWAGYHAIWIRPDGQLREYVPIDSEKYKPWYRMLFFKGVVRKRSK